jgi:pilus assembly protein Flp/PilA
MEYIKGLYAYSRAFLRTRIGDEEGAAMVEYGLLVALIAVVVIITLTDLGQAVKNLFGGVTNDLNGTSTTTTS